MRTDQTVHVLLAFYVTCAAGQSLRHCEDRHQWAKALVHRRKLVLGAFYPRDELLPSLLPAVQLAVQDIRRHECVLTHYDLQVAPSNTECRASKGMKALFSMMHESPKKVALFGGACTAVNEPVASAAKYWNIIQLSYYETHPKFTLGAESHELFRTFYRIVPGVHSEQMAQISFVKRFKWTRFGMVAQKDDERFNLPHARRAVTFEEEHGFTIVASTGFSSKNYAAALSKLKNESARVIIGDFNMTSAGGIFCEAYRQNLTGARHVWILSSQHTRIAVNTSAAEGGCRPDELESALQGHFLFEFAPIRMDRPTDGHFKDVRAYATQYGWKCGRRKGCDRGNPFHAYAYDGVWALALAMDVCINEQWETEGTFFDPWRDLSDYEKWSSRLTTALSNITFEGVTGRVQFHHSNERLGRVRILQYRHGNYVAIGEYDAAGDTLLIPNNTGLFFWTPDDLPPPDEIRRDNKMEYIDFPVFCVMCALTAFGILLAFCFLSVNVYFRNHRFIKMSSPNMNNLIIAGSILTYISVVLLGIDTRMARVGTYNALCTAKVGILSVGFSLAFGSMFSKTWRVHSIFTNIKLNKKAIKDYKLFLIVFVLFLIDTVIVLVWIFVSPLSRREGVLMNETRADLNVITTRWREYCASDHVAIFQGLLFGYKGILLILGCFLAWETRHVNVPALNDSKYIGMSVYNVVLICALGVAILFILENNVNASYVLISLFIIFCTTLTLCLVFVPKIVELARNPKGTGGDRRYRQAMMKSVGTDRKMSEAEQENHKDHLVRAEQDNQVWRKMLDEKKMEIAELLKRLQEYGDVSVDLSSLTKENTSQVSHSSIPDDPYGGVYLGPPGPSFAQQEHEPCSSKSPAPDEVSETTSLLKRPSAGSFRDKLSKLRTSLSRSSVPSAFNTDVQLSNVSVDATGPTLRTSSSMYESLREMASSSLEGSDTRGAQSCGAEIHLARHSRRISTSNSSDYTEEEEEAEAEEAGVRRRLRSRYVEAAEQAPEPLMECNNNNNNSSRLLHSIQENCPSALNSALSSSESAADDEDELLAEVGSEEEEDEEDALL